MGKSKKVTIGFWYSFGIHMGFGRGPIDELLQIKVAEESAWTGSVTTSTSFAINKPNLFGGEKGEGGIQGTAWVMMGDPTQVAIPQLAAMLGSNVPGFRGVATLFYDGKVCALNPYPKPWTFRLRRILQGWGTAVWYPSRAAIPLESGTIRAMNPAHILVECLTNPEWGRGFDIGMLDVASYQTAADQLFTEGFGLCFRWVRQDSVTTFIQVILDHIGAVQDVDRRTGLLTLRLIRDDYIVANLPHYDYSNGLLRVEELETSAIDGSTNTMVVKYRDPITNEPRTCAPIQNLAAVNTSGGTNATTQEYFALPTHALATRLAVRDLQANMGTLKRVKLTFDHAGYDLIPGKVIRVSNAALGISNLVLRIGRQEMGDHMAGEISITALEDVFGLPAAGFVAPSNPEWVPPDRTARNVTQYAAYDATYWDLARSLDKANLNLVTDTQGYLLTLATKPAGLSFYYNLFTQIGSSEPTTMKNLVQGDWAPTGTIVSAIPQAATAVSVVIAAPVDLDAVEAGTLARIDDEDFRIDSVNLITNTVVLTRGVTDTVPAAHAAGARIWLYQNFEAVDPTAYLINDSVNFRMQTKTSTDLLALASATNRAYSIRTRQGKPYPPGNLRFNSTYYPATVGYGTVISWAHRDRKLQADTLVPFTAGNYGPEAGINYRIRIYNGTTLVRTENPTISTVSYTYTEALEIADGGPFPDLRVVMDTVRSGTTSTYAHDVSFGRNVDMVWYRGFRQTGMVNDLSAPVALPAETVVNDLLVAFVVHRSALDVPAGWALAASQKAPTATHGTDQWLSVLTKTAVLGDLGSTVTFTQASAGKMQVNVVACRHAQGLTMKVAAFAVNSGSGASPHTAASVASTAQGSLGLVGMSIVNAPTGNVTLGVVSGFNNIGTQTLPENRLGVSGRIRNNAATTAGTCTSTAGANDYAAISLIITKV